MTDRTRVNLAPLPQPVPRCCERVTKYRAVPSVVLNQAGEPARVGYALEGEGCDCQARFLEHDWKTLGHAEFVKRED
jgi:hypothetical protein